MNMKENSSVYQVN